LERDLRRFIRIGKRNNERPAEREIRDFTVTLRIGSNITPSGAPRADEKKKPGAREWNHFSEERE